MRAIKVIAAVAVGLAVLLGVIGLYRKRNDGPYFGTTKPPNAQRLNYNIVFEPATLDPQISDENASNQVAEAMFDGLTEYHPQTLEPIASLATHYEANADSTQFTFYLRGHKSPKGIRLPNMADLHNEFVTGQVKEDFTHNHKAPPDDIPAHWSDGTLITALDFVYSWRRAVAPATAAANGSFLAPIKNAANINTRVTRFRDKRSGEFIHGKLGSDGTVTEDPQGPLITATASAMRRTPDRFASLLARATPAPYLPEELGVAAIDDFTLQVSLIQPTAFFLKLTPIAVFRAVPRQAIELARQHAKDNQGSETDWLKPENIVVSGAFKLAERMRYDHLKLVKNPQYWDAASVSLSEVNLIPVENNVTGMALYKAGDVDVSMGGSVPQAFVKVLKGNKRDLIVTPATTVIFYLFNTTKKPFDDVRVRRALDMATDKEAVTEYQGNGQVAQWTISPPFPGYSPDIKAHYDLAGAKKLLAEAGYPNGIGPDGKPMHCDLNLRSDDSIKRLCEFLKSQWERNLGIEVELHSRESKVHLQLLQRLQLDGVSFLNYSADYMDPNTYLSNFTSDGALNGGWKDPQYDDLLNRANAEADSRQRMELLAQSESYLMANQIFIPLYVGVWSSVKKPYVSGIVPNLFDKHPLKFVWINREWQTSDSQTVARRN